MTHRASFQKEFLAHAGWGQAQSHPLAGDASSRRYERLSLANRRAVLMDAPPDRGEDVRPFARIGRHLRNLGLSAPEIFAEDPENGFLLLEDLGDAVFTRVIANDPTLEGPLYETTVDALLHLHRFPALPGLPGIGPTELARSTEVAPLWYTAGCTGAAPETLRLQAEQLVGLLDPLLAAIPDMATVLALRDFHAPNLMWLPDRAGVARIGLLDFQDAFAGHPAYDLVSLLRDPRRDVSPDLPERMIARYVQGAGLAHAPFARICAIIGAQRSLRILGVFARLSMHFGKPHYVDMIPRVWGYLMADLAHPDLRGPKDFITGTLPEPTPDRLRRIKERCGTCPNP